ncbi:uncharacterized protein BXZ73DRAFT_76360 [Epithele typhae]|uniref:uncharacterized protein n=1 Tax=Epithele typhae TaxID=378194 RepID=UPI0020078795|nr:uncharacterized protein BXZ73DRAFT_76360 [Epithele typhae]KAH9938859.1 hypothetical protein BXZ73DRAFT_76360 [Epithele typhae]
MASSSSPDVASVAQFVDGSLELLAVNTALSSALFGATTAFALVSTSVLLYAHRYRGVRERAIRALLLASVVLYAPTCVFYGCTLATQSINNRRISATVSALDPVLSTADAKSEVQARRDNDLHVVMTLALTLNITVSDTVVWWRAVAIWGYNKIVIAIGAVLIIGSTGQWSVLLLSAEGGSELFVAISIVATSHIKPHPAEIQLVENVSFLAGDLTGMLGVMVSLLTNALATILMSIKAWSHWRFLRTYLSETPLCSRAVRSILLLVECGAAYCIIWVQILFAVPYGQSVRAQHSPFVQQGQFFSAYNTSFIVIQTCLVSVVAMYPMGVIVIFALKQSPLDNASAAQQSLAFGTWRDVESVPEPEVVDVELTRPFGEHK